MNNDNGFQVKSVDDMALLLHEMYMSFIRSGFTEDQAFTLVVRYFIQATFNTKED